MIELGSTYSKEFSFSQDQVDAFAKITGDDNPIHTNDEYAKKSIFKRRIMHGFLTGSIFSKVFGTLFPGEGTVYLKQNMSFLQPMFVEEVYTANFEIIEHDKKKNRAKVKTTITNEHEIITLTGEALIQNTEKL